MAEIARLYATLGADVRDFVRGMDRAERSLKDLDDKTDRASRSVGGMNKSLRNMAVAAGGLYAVRKAGDWLISAGNAASDFAESVNAVEVASGDAAAGILEMGRTAATELGLSKTAVNEAAVAFSAFNEKIGGGADTFREYATRATDFASVMNLDVNQALQTFQSGLAGEAEPLRRFGIDLSAASVNAYAYANGIAAAGSELTESEKVQARYGSLLEQTNKFAGDFANTSDGLANKQRILAAQFENARIELGDKLVPAMLKATEFGISLIGVASNAAKAYKVWETRVREFNHAITLGIIGDAGPMDKTWKRFNETQNYAIDLMERGRDKAQVFSEWLKNLASRGAINDEVVQAMGSSLELSNDEMRVAIQVATQNADVLGLYGAQLNVLKDVYDQLPMSISATDGELYTMSETAGKGADEVNDLATALNAAATASDRLIASVRSGSWIQRASDRIQATRFLGPGGAIRDEDRVDGFASGGVVPGPLGKPRLIMAHGGEEIVTSADRYSRDVTINMHGNVTSGGNLTDELVTGLLMAGVNEHAEFRSLSDIR